MPTFTSNHFIDLDAEKSSIIAACCEKNQYVHLLLNVIFPNYLNQISFKVTVKNLILSNLIDEIKYKKNIEEFKKKIFCKFNNENLTLSSDYYVNKKKGLKEKKISIINNLYLNKYSFQNDNNMGFFYKEKEISYMERELYLYIIKSKHQGCTRCDLNTFTNESKLISPISKRLFSKFFLFHLKKKNIIKKINWPCILLSKKKKYITEIKAGFRFSQFKIKNFKYICNFFENCLHSIELPPCINCPVQIECHPQGSINPFDCTYMKDWCFLNQRSHW
jgi:hypothetical protein